MNVSEVTIRNTFHQLGYGEVSRIDFRTFFAKNGKLYKRAYIYFYYWFDTRVSQDFQQKIKDPSKITTIEYDASSSYWIILENKKTIGEDLTMFEETEQAINIIPEDSDYIEKIENENESLRQKNNDLEKQIIYKCNESQQIINALFEEIQMLRNVEKEAITTKETYSSQDSFYRYKIKELELDRVDLQMELAHVKELLKQYEPDERRQDKNLYN